MTVMADKILTAEPFEDGTALTVAGVEGTRPGQIRKWKNLLFGSNIAPNGTPAVPGKPAFSFNVAMDQFLRPDEAGVAAGENYYGNCGWGRAPTPLQNYRPRRMRGRGRLCMSLTATRLQLRTGKIGA